MRPFLILLFACASLLGPVHAGMSTDTPFTSRGQTDFDTALQLLNPYGKWAKVGDKWAFTPTDHLVPYTHGRWVYTEYGWYWKGTAPHSWATEHYGYWKRGADKVWAWYPGPSWLPQIVEIRASNKYLGWRTAEVDDQGNFVEQPIDRFSRTDEWTFVTLEQFANPITPSTAAPLEVVRAQLEESTDCRHTYMTYRIIDRPGPHPADFADLSHDGGMVAPVSMEDQAATQAPQPTATTNAFAAKMTGTNTPALLGQNPAAINPGADTRQVKYWITMSLPKFWTAPPADAKANQIYVYRPDFYQDQDGIERRITLWFNPKARTSLKDVLGQHMPGGGTPTTSTGAPAVPAEAATPSHDPFSSPLDELSRAPAEPATNASSKGIVPSGRANDSSK